MFVRAHHQRIATVLSSLNAPLLKKNACYFAGGTAIALRMDEFRESVDVDFMTSDVASYRNLRSLVREGEGLQALRADGSKFELASDIRADQYGIRTRLLVDNTPIKFEIVLEGRITFDTPSTRDVVCGVATLSWVDLAASKILANSDRGLDAATFTRDLIDLAMMQLPPSILAKAQQKAEQAYGASVTQDVQKVLRLLEEKPGLLEANMKKMGMTLPQAVVWQRIRKLKRSFNSP
jgi:hypothetical protein